MPRHPKAVLLPLAALLSGCLGPLVEDDVAAPSAEGLVLPAGSDVPWIQSDPVLGAQVRDNDGVGGLVPLLGGFAGGKVRHYWDFGTAPSFAAPVWILGAADADGGHVPLPDHPALFGVIPGDAGYTPFWQVFTVTVTDAYDGELITSERAVQEAEERGLVHAPVATSTYVNCPIVDREVRVEVGGDQPDRTPKTCYVRGMRCYYFDVGPALQTPEAVTQMPNQNAYRLRREGGEPLSEPDRRVDMTGDGDLVDTNDVFEHAAGDDGYTPLVRVVRVTVPGDTGSIDTHQDDAQADRTAASELFHGTGDAITPVEGAVVAWEAEAGWRNLPQQAPTEEW